MLVITRRLGESIQIGNDITVTITGLHEHRDSGSISVRIGIEAPREIEILRKELTSSRIGQAPSLASTFHD